MPRLLMCTAVPAGPTGPRSVIVYRGAGSAPSVADATAASTTAEILLIGSLLLSLDGKGAERRQEGSSDGHETVRAYDSVRIMDSSTESGPGEVSSLLRAWTDGDHAALQALTPIVYDELRRLAR